MSRKYGALSAIATIFQIIGGLIIVLAVLFYGFAAVLGMFDLFVTRDLSLNNIVTALTNDVFPFLAILIMGIGIVAMGQLIRLLQDMEANSRRAAEDARITAEQTQRIAELMQRQAANRLAAGGEPIFQELPLRKEKRD